jgi:hypothetical protein
MTFRNSALSCGLGVPLALALTGLLAASIGACANSAPNNEHGPVFGLDAGDGAMPDSTATDGPEAADSTTSDGGNPRDSATPADGSHVDSQAADASDGAAPTSDAGDASACGSTMALLAMGANANAEARFSGGEWSVAALTAQGGAPGPAQPALIPYAGGYIGTFVGAGAAPLDFMTYTGAWSAPAQVGVLAAQGTPALASTSAAAHVVYWAAADGKYYHGTFNGAWDSASDRLEVDGGAQSFGSSSPAMASVGSSLVVIQSGSDGLLYDQTWTAGAWQAASEHTGTALITTLAPAVVALDGGTADLMVVYVRAGDYHLDFTTRASTSGSWSTPAEVFDMPGMVAYTGATPALAALPNGGAILVWLGGSPASPYASTYNPATGWTAPASITSLTLASAPAVASGVCGAVAVVALVQTSGQVDVSTLTGTAWSTPAPISGASGMQSVAIASAP